jgi:GT2 family glycosyltransferase
MAALRTLFDETHNVALNVIVFDNASADGSADAIDAAFPQVTLIRSATNVGFAKANNLAVAEAGDEWILLLNPDTEVHDGAVDRLVEFATAHPSAGIYGGRTVFPDGSLNTASCWMKITPWSLFCNAFGLSMVFKKSSLFNPEAMGAWRRDTVREVDIVVGCFFLIRRSLWQRLGGFDLRYFMYGEEADLCLRAARLGFRPMITPDAEIMHIVGAASKSQADKLALLLKARATLVRDHWTQPWRPVGLGLLWAGVAFRAAAFGVLVRLRGSEMREIKTGLDQGILSAGQVGPSHFDVLVSIDALRTRCVSNSDFTDHLG